MPDLGRARHSAAVTAAPPAADGGMLHSLRVYPPFRLLTLGTLATNSAFWMYLVAVGWLALEETDSPFFVGLTGFAGGIPILLFSLPAGVIIDRFSRRTVLMAAQAGVMAAATLFALLIALDALAPWSILLLSAAYGSAMSFVFPTRTTIVPSLVQRGDLANALALNAAGQNVTRVVGPSLAGILIAVGGAGGAFTVAAALQVLALLSTARLPRAASAPSARARAGGSGMTVGLRIIARDPYLSGLIALSLATNVLVMPYINLMPVFARDELGIGSTGLGLLLAAVGVGSVVGALAVARSPGLATRAWTQLASAAVFAALVLLFALAGSLVLAVPLLFAAGWASASFLAINQTALQMRVPDEVRGRVLSVYLMTWGLLPVGQLAVGALADRFGAPLATVVACLFALGWMALAARRYPALRG